VTVVCIHLKMKVLLFLRMTSKLTVSKNNTLLHL